MPPIATSSLNSSLTEGASATNGNGISSALKPTAPSFQPSSTGADPLSTSRFHATSSEEAIRDEAEFAAHNYHPLPVVFARASGCHVWDSEGKEYLDFLSSYSAVNQGHCHPELIKVLVEQASRLTLSSRAFHNDVFPRFAQKVTETFGYEMVLPMNTGAEAVETAVKVARKWGYKVKGIPQGEAIVLGVTENFHGRTFGAITLSTDPESRDNYGPYLPNLGPVCPSTGDSIRFGSIEDITKAFNAHGARTAALLIEPIQGEAGIIVPPDNYLREVKQLCEKHNVLMICDEVQSGIGRTGKMLAHEWWGIKPDMVTLGKAISGGMYPVSCVLASKEILLTVEPGTHGSTYGGNPLGSAVAIRALEIIEEENMVANAQRLGERFRAGLEKMQAAEGEKSIIKLVRGKGLFNAVLIDKSNMGNHTAWDLCMLFKKHGLLTKPTHETAIRFSPPLVITEAEIDHSLAIIGAAMAELSSLRDAKENAA